MNAAGPAVVVTGGASGIGAATAAAFTAAGARVVALDHRRRDDAPVPVLDCDVTDEGSVVAAMADAAGRLGGLDVAVLSAGVGGYAPLLEMTGADWDAVHAVNARGVFLTLREAARVMVDAGRGGAIVAISSISARLGERGMAHYGSSKAAVDQLVRIAARELGPHRIRVNAVAPGTTDTPLFASTARLPGYRRQVADRAALAAVGRAEAVAAAVVALAGLDWVTGAVLPADGGVSLWSPIDPTERMG